MLSRGLRELLAPAAVRGTLILAAATLLVGCSEKMEPRRAPQADTGVARTRAAAQDLSALQDAVAMVTRLEYAQAAGILGPLAGRLGEAGDGPHAAEACFWLGYCWEKQGQAPKAMELYQQAQQHYPGTRGAEMSQRRAAQLAPNPAALP